MAEPDPYAGLPLGAQSPEVQRAALKQLAGEIEDLKGLLRLAGLIRDRRFYNMHSQSNITLKELGEPFGISGQAVFHAIEKVRKKIEAGDIAHEPADDLLADAHEALLAAGVEPSKAVETIVTALHA